MIRPAEQKDAAAVLNLAKDFATSFSVDAQSFQSSFAQLVSAPAAYLAVAEVEGQVIGYVLGFSHLTLFANGRVAWVEELMVNQANRRQGIGRLLMQSVETWAMAQGCQLIALATRRAADFYKTIDYQESAIYLRKLLS